MAADQLNYAYASYESDDGDSYCIKANAADTTNTDLGGAACTTEKPYGAVTKRRSPRRAIFRDGTTFRTHTAIVFTSTAYAALTVGSDSVSLHIPGNTATAEYLLVKKVPERVPSTVIGRQDPDHA